MEILDTSATAEINVNDDMSVGEPNAINQSPVGTDSSCDDSFTISFSDGQ